MPWGFLFSKNGKIQIKKLVYTLYAKMISNETYFETISKFSEWDVNVLLTQESFVHLEKSQSTPEAEGRRVDSLQMQHRPNSVIG